MSTLDERLHERIRGPWDERRCRVCGWPIDLEMKLCRPGNCSLRPVPQVRADAAPAYSTDPVASAALLDWMVGQGWCMEYTIHAATSMVRVYDGVMPLSGAAVMLSEDHRPARALALAAARALGIDPDAPEVTT